MERRMNTKGASGYEFLLQVQINPNNHCGIARLEGQSPQAENAFKREVMLLLRKRRDGYRVINLEKQKTGMREGNCRALDWITGRLEARLAKMKPKKYCEFTMNVTFTYEGLRERRERDGQEATTYKTHQEPDD